MLNLAESPISEDSNTSWTETPIQVGWKTTRRERSEPLPVDLSFRLSVMFAVTTGAVLGSSCLQYYIDATGTTIGRRAGNKAVAKLSHGDTMNWEPWRQNDSKAYARFWSNKTMEAQIMYPFLAQLHAASAAATTSSASICSDEIDAFAGSQTIVDERPLRENETVMIPPMTAVLHFRCSDVPFIRWNM